MGCVNGPDMGYERKSERILVGDEGDCERSRFGKKGQKIVLGCLSVKNQTEIQTEVYWISKDPAPLP